MLKSFLRICAFFIFVALFLFGFFYQSLSSSDNAAMTAFKKDVALQINAGKTEFPAAEIFKSAGLGGPQLCMVISEDFDRYVWSFQGGEKALYTYNHILSVGNGKVYRFALNGHSRRNASKCVTQESAYFIVSRNASDKLLVELSEKKN